MLGNPVNSSGRKHLSLQFLHNFIMENYSTDWMIQLPQETLKQIRDEAKDLLVILNGETPDIHSQVGKASCQGVPLCRADYYCCEPCVVRNPWDPTLLPKLSDADCIYDWLATHGIQHTHPFYGNFCSKHESKYARINGEWVQVPDLPVLRRSGVERNCAPPDEQEGPLFYAYSDTEDEQDIDEECLREIMRDISARA